MLALREPSGKKYLVGLLEENDLDVQMGPEA